MVHVYTKLQYCTYLMKPELTRVEVRAGSTPSFRESFAVLGIRCTSTLHSTTLSGTNSRDDFLQNKGGAQTRKWNILNGAVTMF